MKKLLVVVFLAIAVVTMGQAFPPRYVSLSPPASATSSALDVYVDTAGSDSNNCLTALTPCATIQKALGKVPATVRHPVTVHLAAGSYAGPTISGFSFDLTNSTTEATNAGAFIKLLGTYTTTLAGTTATGGTKGSYSDGTEGTVVVDGGTFTTNQYRGKLLHFTASSGVGTTKKWPIISNTATTITFAGAIGGAPVNNDTFEVLDWGTTIGALSTGNPGQPATASGSLAASSNRYGVSLMDTGPGLQNVAFEGINFSESAGTAFVGIKTWGQEALSIINCAFGGTTMSTGVSATANSQVYAFRNVFLPGRSNAIMFSSASPSFGAQFGAFSELLLGENFFLGTGGTFGVGVEGDGWSAITQNNYFSNLQRGMWTGRAIVESINDVFDTNQNGITQTLGACSGGSLLVIGDYFLNNSVVALRVDGHCIMDLTGTTSHGTGNAIGLQSANAGTVHISSSTDVQGTTQLQVDSTTSDYATLRAASPQAVLSTLSGARIYQQ